MEKLTHWRKTTDTNYLGSWSLENETGYGTAVFTISKVTQEEVLEPTSNKKSIKTICYFEENVKPMIINTTNKKTIAKSVGSDFIEKWVGHRIEIGVEKVKAFGEVHEALRVKEKTIYCECAICKKKVSSQFAQASESKYGIILCSAECKTKAIENNLIKGE